MFSRGWCRMSERLPDLDRLRQNEVRVSSGNPDVEHARIFRPKPIDNHLMLWPDSKRLSIFRLDGRVVDLCKSERFFKGRYVRVRRRGIGCSLADIVEGVLN